MKRILIAALAVLAFSTVHATKPGNSGGGNGGCGQGQTTNGCGTTPSTGGAGGTGIGVGIAGAAATSNATAVAAQTQGQQQGQTQQALGGNAHSVSGGNTQSVNVAAQERDPVATAYAPSLTATNGTCLGSASGGIQGAAVGFAFGSTHVDAGCDARYDASALRAAGHARAADARLCQKPEIAEAMAAAGTPCTDARKTAPAKVSGYSGTDPIVLARMRGE